MRVIATALAICAVSFVADVAGDLTVGSRHPAADAAQAASAHVELPPYLVGATRAHPLPPRHTARHHRRERAEVAMATHAKPHRQAAKSMPKTPPERAPKPHSVKHAAIEA
ncbi:MAG TPA: hypothetical protein VG841_01260 [Caulobacterales bacterium]|nr:hypothetical protein [Caulobacterales bacterium]